MSTNMLHHRPDKMSTVRFVHGDSGLRSTAANPYISHMSHGFKSVQTAIDDLPSTGGTVFLSLGTHYVETPLVLTKSAVNIIGAGRDGTIIKANATISSVFSSSNIYGGSLENLTVDGNSMATSGVIMGAGTFQFDIDGCRFINNITTDLNMSTSMDCYVNRCYFPSTSETQHILIQAEANMNHIDRCFFIVTGSNYGIQVGGGAGAFSQGPSIRDCTFTGSGIGVYQYNGYVMSVKDSRFFGISKGIILGSDSVAAVAHAMIEGNYFHNLSSNSIEIMKAERCDIGPNTHASTGTYVFVNSGSNSYYNVIWNLSNYYISDSGIQTMIWMYVDNALRLCNNQNSSAFSIGTTASSKIGLSHDGTSGYILGVYHGNPAMNAYFDMSAGKLVGFCLYPNNADYNGIAVRFGNGSGTDVKGGAVDGALYVDTASNNLYFRSNGSWKYITASG